MSAASWRGTPVTVASVRVNNHFAALRDDVPEVPRSSIDLAAESLRIERLKKQREEVQPAEILRKQNQFEETKKSLLSHADRPEMISFAPPELRERVRLAANELIKQGPMPPQTDPSWKKWHEASMAFSEADKEANATLVSESSKWVRIGSEGGVIYHLPPGTPVMYIPKGAHFYTGIEKVVGPEGKITATNEEFGRDPAPGIPKELWAKMKGGRRRKTYRRKGRKTTRRRKV